MIVLAWFPPIWRRVMDPKLVEHYDGEIELANIQPRKREKILARYGGPRPADEDGGTDGCLPLSRAAATPTTRRPATRARASRAGTPWSEVPDDWACPDCGVRDKVDFEPVEEGG